MNSMKQDVLEYLETLQQIVECREADFENWSTPYALETKRRETHRRLFENHIQPFLEDGTDIEDAYQRSKDIFSNLDRVYAIFNAMPFDINDHGEMTIFSRQLASFLLKTEVLYYLEGKTKYLRNVVEPLTQQPKEL